MKKYLDIDGEKERVKEVRKKRALETDEVFDPEHIPDIAIAYHEDKAPRILTDSEECDEVACRSCNFAESECICNEETEGLSSDKENVCPNCNYVFYSSEDYDEL